MSHDPYNRLGVITASDAQAVLAKQIFGPKVSLSSGGGGTGGGSSPTTSLGDLIVRGATVDSRLGVGANGQVLTARSGATLGVDWETPAGGSGGSGQAPGLIADLQFWFDATQLLTSNTGYILAELSNLAPGHQGLTPYNYVGGTGTVTTATKLNGLPVVYFTGNQGYAFGGTAGTNSFGIDTLQGATFFVVFNADGLAYGEFFSSNTSAALAFRMDNAGHTQLLNPGVSAFATATTAVAAGTWFQGNATYSYSTGGYAFRTGRAAAGSGTSVQGGGNRTNLIGVDGVAGATYLKGYVAEMLCYARVLTPTEITTVENYLNTKWGV